MAVNSAAGDVASKWQIYVILNQCSGILYFLSTCINPLLYNIMSHKFRDAFKVRISEPSGGRRETFIQSASERVRVRHPELSLARGH